MSDEVSRAEFEALKAAMARVVANHAEHIRGLMIESNRRLEENAAVAEILERAIIGATEPRKPVTLRLLEYGDNVLTCSKFRERRP